MCVMYLYVFTKLNRLLSMHVSTTLLPRGTIMSVGFVVLNLICLLLRLLRFLARPDYIYRGFSFSYCLLSKPCRHFSSCAAEQEQSTAVDIIKGSIRNSLNLIQVDKQLMKAGVLKDRNVVIITTKSRTIDYNPSVNNINNYSTFQNFFRHQNLSESLLLFVSRLFISQQHFLTSFQSSFSSVV